MKRKLLQSMAIFGLLIFASCSTIDSGNEDNEKTDKAYIKISLADKDARGVALPTIDDKSEFDSFELIGETGGKVEIKALFEESYGIIDEDEGPYPPMPYRGFPDGVPYPGYGDDDEPYPAFPGDRPYPGYWNDGPTVGVKPAYENLEEAVIAASVGETYDFTLIAKKGGAVWKGSTSAKIKAGENTLFFKLELVDISSTDYSDSDTGSLSVSLSVPSVVKGVSAKLFHMDGVEVDNKIFHASNLYNNNSLYLRNGEAYFYLPLPAGNYMLRFELFGDEKCSLKLGEWREYAGIAAGAASESSPEIKSEDELESIYKIYLAPNGGSFPAEATAVGSYTSYSDDITLSVIRECVNFWKAYTRYSDDITLSEEIAKNAFVFKGWNKTDSDGNVLLPKTKITKVSKGSLGDVYASAEWTESGIHEDEDSQTIFIRLESELELESESAW